MIATFNMKSEVQKSSGWRLQVAALKRVQSELSEIWPFMSEAERFISRKELSEVRAWAEPFLISSAVREFESAADRLGGALAAVKAAKQREQTRWEAGRLSNEMAVIERQVAAAIGSSQVRGMIDEDAINRIKSVYRDALESGDAYQRKAANTIYSGILARAPGDDIEVRRSFNLLAVLARQDEADQKNTLELQAAHSMAAERTKALDAVRVGMIEACEALGQTWPNGGIMNNEVLKALSRVEPKNGTFIIDGVSYE